MTLITKPREALDNIGRLQHELDRSPALASRLGQAHVFYIDDRGDGGALFGFSKFVGYKGLDAESYMSGSTERSGTHTEVALSEFFEELDQKSKLYQAYYDDLVEWLAQYGKTPRKNVRLMVLRPEFRSNEHDAREDRSLLDLMVLVAEMLPAHQRQELRSRV